MISPWQYTKGAILSVIFYAVDFIYPKRKNIVLIGAGSGRSYMNNSRYLFEYLKEKEPKIKPLWVTRNLKVKKYITKRFGEGSVLMPDSLKVYHYLFMAKTVFVSHGSNDILFLSFNPSPRKKVVYLDHGVANKKTGHSIFDKKNIGFALEFARYDFWIGQSYIEAIVNNKNFRKSINRYLITGMPKMDGIQKGRGKTIKNILYAPTYGAKNLFPFNVDLIKLDDFLGELGMNLTISAHRNDYLKKTKNNNLGGEYKRINWTDQDETFDIQGNTNSADLLITDYSSMFWDFMYADKPIIFVCPKEGPETYDELTLLDHGFIAGDLLATNFTGLVNLLEKSKSGFYKGRAKLKRDIIVDLFFDKDQNELTGSEAITEKLIDNQIKKKHN